MYTRNGTHIYNVIHNLNTLSIHSIKHCPGDTRKVSDSIVFVLFQNSIITCVLAACSSKPGVCFNNYRTGIAGKQVNIHERDAASMCINNKRDTVTLDTHCTHILLLQRACSYIMLKTRLHTHVCL